jgi:hypothetical protein
MIVGVSTPATGRVGVAVGLAIVIIGVLVGAGVGVDVAQIQFVDVVHCGFRHWPPEHTMLVGQSELVVHVVPH